MLKKIGLPMLALAGLLAFAAPRAAEARVHIGVAIGGPVYAAPVAPYAYPYQYGYAPPAYADPYYAPPAYVAPAPVVVNPYLTFGFGGGWGGYSHGYVGHGYARGHEFRGGFRGGRR